MFMQMYYLIKPTFTAAVDKYDIDGYIYVFRIRVE